MYNMEVSFGSYKFRLEILILIVVMFWVMFGHLLCSCCRVGFREGLETIGKKVAAGTLITNNTTADTNTNTTKEGFVSSNNVTSGPEFAEAHMPDYIMNPSTWSNPTLTYSPGTKPDAGVESIWNRPKQPVPLPEGQLDMFATTEFKPECCPNAYSSSSGCACMTVPQYQMLTARGGNNVPYSEY